MSPSYSAVISQPVSYTHLPRRLSVEHPGEIPLKLRPLKEVAEVIALHLEGQPGPFFAVGAAPEQVADALPAGGVALLLPELHPASRPVQNHHLSNAAEIPDGVDGVPYRNGDAAAPVSYTHLDVYKRQGEEWLEQLLPYLSANFDFVVDYCKEHIPQIKTCAPDATYLMWLDCRALGLDLSLIHI